METIKKKNIHEGLTSETSRPFVWPLKPQRIGDDAAQDKGLEWQITEKKRGGRLGGSGGVGKLEIGPKARHSMPRSRLHPVLLQRALKSLQSHSDKL